MPCRALVFAAYETVLFFTNTLFDDVLHYCFCFVFAFCMVSCPCMVINNVSVQYNGGLLADIILLTQCYYNTIGEEPV